MWRRVGPASAEATRPWPDLSPHLKTGAGGDCRGWPCVDGADDLAAVHPLEVDARDAEVRVSQLPLNHDKRDTFVRHLNRVGVPQLVGREPPSHARGRGRVMQLFTRGRRFPTSSGSRSVNHAQAPRRSEARGGSPARGQVGPMPSGPFRPRGACRPSRAGRPPRRVICPDRSPESERLADS